MFCLVLWFEIKNPFWWIVFYSLNKIKKKEEGNINIIQCWLICVCVCVFFSFKKLIDLFHVYYFIAFLSILLLLLLLFIIYNNMIIRSWFHFILFISSFFYLSIFYFQKDEYIYTAQFSISISHHKYIYKCEMNKKNYV